MSSNAARERAAELAERMRPLGPIAITRFFGGAGLRLNEVQFAFVIKGVVYFRVDTTSRAAFEARGAKPFSYMGRNKTVLVTRYYEVPDDVVEDDDELCHWAARAIRIAKEG